jgi:outer membrane protein OmpA-like peptidoglycan-associated protein
LYVGINLQELLSKVTSEKPGSIQPQEPVAVQMPEPEEQQVTSSTLDNTDAYQYLFNVTNATNLKEVTGYIKIIDAARNKVMKSVSTNQIHTINAPGTETNEIIVLCDIFGFVKEQIVLKTDDPINSPDKAKISQKDGITTVTFSLSRHKKVGEILTMFNVYFYKDAAIMKPESIFELNNLLSMVKENEKLTIRIHGHTNGNSAGKIISLKKDDDNFFQVTNNNIKGFGSAKELSKQRAEVIQRWLMSNGISKSRMELKAWGGKKMIYKKRDKMAERNVRVEIEILKL